MEKIKKNLHSWNNHVFLGFSFVVFSIIISAYWGITYAADVLPSSTSGTSLSPDGTVITDTILTVPKAPTELSFYYITALTPTMTYIPLKWKDNDVTNLNKFFLLERKTTGHDDLITLTKIYTTTVSNTNTTGLYYYKDTTEVVPGTSSKSVVPGVSYDYQVRACVTEIVCSDPSYFRNVFIPAVTIGGNTPVSPDAPIDLVQKIIYTTTTTATTKTVTPSVELSWTDKSSNESKFLIKRKLSDEATYPTSTSLYKYTAANIATFTDYTVSPGYSYDYSVQSCITETLCSSVLEIKGILVPKSIITTIEPQPKNAPSVVTDLKKDSAYTNDTSSYIIIKWLYDYTNDVKFNIGRKTAGLTTSAYTNIGFTVKGDNNYKDTTVEPGVPYDYGVSSCSLENVCSDYIELKNISSPSLTIKVPLNPSSLTNEINNSIVGYPVVTLSWKDNAVNEDRYVVERRNNLNSTYIKLSDSLRPGTINFLDKIEPGIYYEYRIKACYLTTCSDYVSLPGKVFVAKAQVVEPTKVIEPIKTTEPIKTAPVLKIEPIAETKTTTPVDVKTTKSVVETSNNIESSNVIVEKEENNVELSAVNIEEVINVLSKTSRTDINKINEESELIYQDTNNDGISDYDSKYIYNIDPKKSSPVSLYEGKNINASEKILLGYDPTKTELVKIEKEEPTLSKASTLDTYKVKEMELTEKKNILIKGQALPNSYITLYIYSTPIMVTVKTDNKGEWQYVLDKELEDGEHTVYTATVNNTGNIVAKSSPYLFTKTAEAVTLRDIPVAEASSAVAKPGLIESKGIYIIILGLLMAVGITLILVGLFTKKENQVIN